MFELVQGQEAEVASDEHDQRYTIVIPIVV
jgi:hypothetical protein